MAVIPTISTSTAIHVASPSHLWGHRSVCRVPVTRASRPWSPCHHPFCAVADETPLRRPLRISASATCRAATDGAHELSRCGRSPKEKARWYVLVGLGLGEAAW